jgi:AcrR family transcriptional regulator
MPDVAETGKSRQQVDRDQRRQQLIDAARDLFADKGYHATTVDDITRAAGVAKGTFYLYFREKREVYYQVIREFMDLVMEIGGSVGESTEPSDFFGRAEKAALELMTVFLENRQLARLAYREFMGLDPELERMLTAFYRQLAEIEARNLSRAMDLGLIRPVEPLLVAYAHIGMVERVLLAIVDAPDDFPEPRRAVAELMRMAMEGLRRD